MFRHAFRRKVLMGLGIFASLCAVSACKRRSPEQRAEWVTQKVSSKLDLTESQKAKLAVVKSKFLDAHKEMGGNRVANLDELIRQIETNKIDQTKLTAMVNDHADGIRKQAPTFVAALADFEQSLDDTQRAKVVSFLKHIREKVAEPK